MANEDVGGIGQEISVGIDIPEEAFTEDFLVNYTKYLNEYIYSDGLQEELDLLLAETKEIGAIEDLDTYIQQFTTIHERIDKSDAAHYLADNELLGWSQAFDVHGQITNRIYTGRHLNTLIQYANHLAIGYTQGASGFQLLLQDVVENNPIERADDELARIDTLVRYYANNKEQGSDIQLEIKDGKLISPEVEESDLKLPTEEDLKDNGPELTPPDSEGLDDVAIDYSAPQGVEGQLSSGTNLNDRDGTYYEYDAANGRRIRVDYTIRYVNGEEVRNETRTVDATGLSSMWSDRYDAIFGNINSENADADLGQGGLEEVDEAEEEIRLSLQYTLNKDDQFPVYVDTGIFTDANGNASYQSVYDVLYQIAINMEDGHLVEDSNKLLIVVEGRPIFILEEDESYTATEVEAIFKDFEKINLIVTETRIGTTNSLEWQLKTGQEQTVLIDGQDVTFNTAPEIRNERVVLPIEELMQAVGAEVTVEEGLITVQYGEDTMTFELGVADARLNGELVPLDVPVEVNGHGIHTANLTPIFERLNIEAVWDEQESTLFIDNTLRPKVEEDSETEDVEEPEE